MAVENGLSLLHGRNISAIAVFVAATTVFTHTPIEWEVFDPTNSLHVLLKILLSFVLFFIGILLLKFDKAAPEDLDTDTNEPYQVDMFGSAGMTSDE